MTILVGVLLMAAIAAVFLALVALRQHGLAGCLYLLAAALYAAADAVLAAQQRHRESWPLYRARAEELSR